MIELIVNEHELKSQVLDEIMTDINAGGDSEEHYDGDKHYKVELSEQVKNFIISEWGCDYDTLNEAVNEMIGAISKDLKPDGITIKGINKEEKEPFDFDSDKLVAYRDRLYEVYRSRMAEQRKSIEKQNITCRDDDMRDLLVEKITVLDTYDLDTIMSACRELDLTLGFRYTDDEIIAVETMEGAFCGHLYKNKPVYESGKYKIDDYDKRIEVLTEAMLEMNDYYYDVQINCWYASDKTDWRNEGEDDEGGYYE